MTKREICVDGEVVARRGKLKVDTRPTIFNDPVFAAQYGGQTNFLTPTIMERGHRDDRALYYELSRGKGFVTPTIFGVTVVEHDLLSGWTWSRHDLSKCFDSLEAAEGYIQDVLNVAPLLCQGA